MTFEEICGRVAQYLNRDDLVPLIQNWVVFTQRKVERANNFKHMEVRKTTSSAEAYITMPTNFKHAIAMYILESDIYYPLTKVSFRDALYSFPFSSTSTGRPEAYAISEHNSEILVRPMPDKSYTYDLYYYEYTTDLSASTDTNWWTTNAPDVLLYGALKESIPNLGEDPRLNIWNNLFNEAVQALVSAEYNEQFSGSLQNIRPSEDVANL